MVEKTRLPKKTWLEKCWSPPTTTKTKLFASYIRRENDIRSLKGLNREIDKSDTHTSAQRIYYIALYRRVVHHARTRRATSNSFHPPAPSSSILSMASTLWLPHIANFLVESSRERELYIEGRPLWTDVTDMPEARSTIFIQSSTAYNR